jgi:hypothetical protein
MGTNAANLEKMNSSRKWRRRGAALAVAAALLAAAAAPSPAGSKDVRNLRRQADVKIVGGGQITHVASAGDVNGDGIPDMLVSKGSVANEPTQGRNWVIFGQRPMPPLIDLDDPSTYSGFVIEGADEDDGAYESVGAGDINGDGLGDIIVGAGGGDNNLRFNSGTTYIVFGKKDTAPVLLAAFDAGTQGTLGYRIDGPHELALAGRWVAAPGDMNDDGLADILIGAPFAGRSYVVFGKADTAPIDLRSFEGDTTRSMLPGEVIGEGFRIETPSPDADRSYSVGAAGDVNGDGIPDVVIGVIGSRQSCACVVFGKADSEPVKLRSLGDKGFKIKGPNIYWAVAGAGDVNGDGLDDVIVGAPYTDHCCGRAHVIFGKRDSEAVDVKNLGKGGYWLVGSGESDRVGTTVASAGDINGDGRADVLVGATGVKNDANGRLFAGAAYVQYGKESRKAVRFDEGTWHGFRLTGGKYEDFVGASVAGVGDVNGDAVPDLLIGSEAGQAYLVYARP